MNTATQTQLKPAGMRRLERFNFQPGKTALPLPGGREGAGKAISSNPFGLKRAGEGALSRFRPSFSSNL